MFELLRDSVKINSQSNPSELILKLKVSTLTDLSSFLIEFFFHHVGGGKVKVPFFNVCTNSDVSTDLEKFFSRLKFVWI